MLVHFLAMKSRKRLAMKCDQSMKKFDTAEILYLSFLPYMLTLPLMKLIYIMESARQKMAAFMASYILTVLDFQTTLLNKSSMYVYRTKQLCLFFVSAVSFFSSSF